MSALPLTAGPEARRARYQEIRLSLEALLEGEDDWIAAMATVACELHHGFDYYDWTGFYRRVGPSMLKIGPYQGGHGCLSIDFSRGVCGAAARTGLSQKIDDVNSFAGHIACASTTLSEIVVPLLDREGRVFAVLDVDSNATAAFTEVDEVALKALCRDLGQRFGLGYEEAR